ncbi:hypothetical protein EHYA_08469 [Embleya hyalina]|uniref:Uncharacterized protein n=2 Tax=Embleya hyalina TaxID=516124 RepID=A0A401Z1I6_9ACTN|nr:hypothetical protein EHYA_08469 [Embleya hyalina]
MIASAGVGLAAYAVAAAGRKWARRRREFAREHTVGTLHRALAASRAGRQAWRRADGRLCD